MMDVEINPILSTLRAVRPGWWWAFGIVVLLVILALWAWVALNARGEEIALERRVAAHRIAMQTNSLGDAFRATRMILEYPNGTKREITGAQSNMIWYTLDDGTGRAVVVARSRFGDFFSTSFTRRSDGATLPVGDFRPMTIDQVTELVTRNVPVDDKAAVAAAVAAANAMNARAPALTTPAAPASPSASGGFSRPMPAGVRQ